eukprot:766673-Hanusia_phi.AAC.7
MEISDGHVLGCGNRKEDKEVLWSQQFRELVLLHPSWRDDRSECVRRRNYQGLGSESAQRCHIVGGELSGEEGWYHCLSAGGGSFAAVTVGARLQR